ncbi:Uncharacterised protein [Mycobacteroides abscessus subsp. bolletii]|nr:Uncharacterised protein [Mycobacteroides abscessus subsp. bolletii]SLD79704.1 Uncharacterised protein [Mycobacteroides abscessus subsp. bolletii]SLD86681.1 Uncharacterised protein [Mycobacteroides abscessus subsp. bolletii]
MASLMQRVRTAVTGAGVSLALCCLCVPVAAADPQPVPFEPGAPGALPSTPGSFSYTWNNVQSVAPATVDAWGVKVAATADPRASATGMPDSKLNNSSHTVNSLTSASIGYGVLGGVSPAAPASATGVQFGAGDENLASEDPCGRSAAAGANSVPGGAESVAPATVFPGAPATPVLESADGQPLTPHDAATTLRNPLRGFGPSLGTAPAVAGRKIRGWFRLSNCSIRSMRKEDVTNGIFA